MAYPIGVNDDFTIIYEEGEQGWILASIPEIPGAFSQGKTEAEAREMVLDCAHELMAFRREEALKLAHPTRVEQVKFAT